MGEDISKWTTAPTSLYDPSENTFHLSNLAQPNDEREQDRLDILHHIYRLVLGGWLHSAPTGNPQQVADHGAGTALWALEYAE